MTTQVKVYAHATGRLPVWDEELGMMVMPKDSTGGGGGTNNDGRVGDTLAAAARDWQKAHPGTTLLQATLAVGRGGHAESYAGELRETGGLRTPS
jgi:hypothetical protein